MLMPGDCEGEAQPPTCTVLDGGPCSACREREIIRQKMELLETEITNLKAKYDNLASTVNAIHDPFIRKLPPEIGSHVFLLTLPTFGIESSSRKLITAGSLKLGAVCRQWRQLAWATPDLWDSVYLSIVPTMSRSLANSLPGLLSEWLGRSGALPLTIAFHHDCPNRNYLEDEFSGDDDSRAIDAVVPSRVLEVATALVIETLNLYSGQWRNLVLTAGAPIFKRFSGSIQPKQLSVIELKNISEPVLGSRSTIPEFKPGYKLSPTELKLTNFLLASADIGCENITVAMVDCMTAEEVLDFLRRAPKLEYYLAIIQRPTPRLSADPARPILHPQLRPLHLYRYTRDIERFLETINLPSLEEWTLFGQVFPLTSMLSFLKRSGCSLKVLHLHIENAPPSADFITLLQAIPSLEELHIGFDSAREGSADFDEVLTQIFCLAPPSNTISLEVPKPGCLLPRLKVMGIFPFPSSLRDHILRLYRQGHRRSLRLDAVIDERPIIPDETALQLLQLVDEGVDLRIFDENGGRPARDFLKNFRKKSV